MNEVWAVVSCIESILADERCPHTKRAPTVESGLSKRRAAKTQPNLGDIVNN